MRVTVSDGKCVAVDLRLEGQWGEKDRRHLSQLIVEQYMAGPIWLRGGWQVVCTLCSAHVPSLLLKTSPEG